MENLFYCLLAFLLCCFLLILSKKLLSKKIKNKKLPPSPPALPIIGHLHLVKNELYQDLTSLASTYGPVFSLRFGCRSFVVISSPAAIEDCFTRNDIILANRPPTIALERYTYNYSTIGAAPYGHLWRVLRRLAVVEAFSFNSLQKSSIIREEEIRMILRSLFQISRNESTRVNLKYWVSVFNVNVITRMLIGRGLIREEDAGNEMGKQIVEELRSLFSSGAAAMNLCDYFPMLRWIRYRGLEKGMLSLHKKRDQFLLGFLDEIRRGKSDSSTLKNGMQKEKKAALIETLLSHQELEPEFLSDDIVKGIALIMFTAGRETSILTIEWAMSLLINHPRIMQKLRTEIDYKVGNQRLLNESDIPKLHYLRCVINETMRLYTAAPLLLPHYGNQDFNVCGYDIPKGTTVLANVWAVHRDPKLWERPEEFVPERFEVHESSGKEDFSFKFLPFGIGRRACPGANLGIRNVSLAVGALVQCFHWETVGKEDGDMDTSFDNKITLNKAKSLEAMCFPLQKSIKLLSQLGRQSIESTSSS